MKGTKGEDRVEQLAQACELIAAIAAMTDRQELAGSCLVLACLLRILGD